MNIEPSAVDEIVREINESGKEKQTSPKDLSYMDQTGVKNIPVTQVSKDQMKSTLWETQQVEVSKVRKRMCLKGRR